MMPGAIKLFADGAIYSLAMQVREPYLGGGHGEWMIDTESSRAPSRSIGTRATRSTST